MFLNSVDLSSSRPPPFLPVDRHWLVSSLTLASAKFSFFGNVSWDQSVQASSSLAWAGHNDLRGPRSCELCGQGRGCPPCASLTSETQITGWRVWQPLQGAWGGFLKSAALDSDTSVWGTLAWTRGGHRTRGVVPGWTHPMGMKEKGRKALVF